MRTKGNKEKGENKGRFFLFFFFSEGGVCSPPLRATQTAVGPRGLGPVPQMHTAAEAGAPPPPHPAPHPGPHLPPTPPGRPLRFPLRSRSTAENLASVVTRADCLTGQR